MSTKAMREALKRLRFLAPEVEPGLAADAEREVEAIERAAKVLMQGRQFRGSAETIGTLASIEKDAP